MQLLLMSIRPRFSDQILNGHKHFELRRRPLRVQSGAVVVIYASAPIRAVVGAFVAAGILTRSVPALWDELSAQFGVAKDEYDSYFAGAQVGHAIAVGARVRIEPVPLHLVRQRRPGFRPPQSYMYLREDLAGLLGQAGARQIASIGRAP
jgi:predicted transcriptional regulator